MQRRLAVHHGAREKTLQLCMSSTIQACGAFHDFVFFILDKYFLAHFKQTLANYAIEAEKLATKKY